MENIKLGSPVPQLPVEDVLQAQAYYNEVWGFNVLWTEPGNVIGAVGNGDVTLFLAKADKPIVPNIHWIYTENVDMAYADLKKRGVEIIEHLETKPWNIRQFAVKDLNGHIFYIHQG